MKIGIFTNNYLPNPYGVTSSVESFRKEFERWGHEVFIFAPRWKDYQDQNLHVFRYPSLDVRYKFRFPLAIPYSGKIDVKIEKLGLDVIHSQHPNLLGSAARKWAQKKNIPLIFTWHTLYDRYAHFVPLIPQKWVAAWAIRNARKYADEADRVVVPSGSVREIIRKWGVVRDDIAVIPTGVERELEDPDREVIRKKFHLPSNSQILFLNSRLTEEKNVRFLFDAILPLLEENKKLYLLIVGDGYLRNELEAMCVKEDVSSQVIFCGVVPKAEVKNYYAAGNIFVYASKSETQGMIINEALFSGLPVVAVRAPGIVDGVEDGKTGILVSEDGEEFRVAVKRLLSEKELRRRFSGAGKKEAREKYTAEISAAKMLRLYEEAIESHRKKVL